MIVTYSCIGLFALNYIISCAYWCVLQQKIETPALVEFVSNKSPITSVDVYLSWSYAGIDGLNVVLNSCQQP
jgi:hypothetical protein